VPDFDEVSDRTYVTAGADFAFVLTRRGRLVTRHAPRDMPQEGRSRIVEAAIALRDSARFGHLELPREDIVPYGGAAPVDIYFGIAPDALLCVVMPTWADSRDVLPALEAGVQALEQGAGEEGRGGRKASSKRHPSRPRIEAVPPSSRRPGPDVREPPPSTRRPDPPSSSDPAAAAPSSAPPRKGGAMAGLMALATAAPIRSLARPAALQNGARGQAEPPRQEAPSQGSMPEIRIGQATLGRESLAAIERDLGVARPSLPDIRMGTAPIGRETLVAIGEEAQQSARPGSAPEAVRVDLASISRESLLEIAAEEARQATLGPRPSMPLILPDRGTKPWVEAPEDAKRAVDAEKRARNQLPPELELEVIEPDSEVFDAAVQDRGGGR
jgi:hypothetical protein